MKCRLIHIVSKTFFIKYKNGCEITISNLPLNAILDDYVNLVSLLEPVMGHWSGAGFYNCYNTESGKPEPGDMFWRDWTDVDGNPRQFPWTNEEGRHLHVILPNGIGWDIDSRGSNCTMKDDKTHRCWIRHGEPPNITVDKNGHTCAAGAGSIQGGDFHGFLQNGELLKA